MLSPSSAAARSRPDMALFPFPGPGRKKTASQPASLEPLSKAHKILGSTPLSIDAPPPSNRDDGSSSDDRSVTSATTSCDTDYDHVGIAKSDTGSALFLRPPRLDLDGSEPSILRKSPSSSTIRSWYDKSKLPLSVSQQTSSSAMAKGLPCKPDRTPAAGNCLEPWNHKKRKPSGLDLDRTHLGQPVVGPVLSPGHIMKSPSILSTLAPSLRPRRRRHTDETLPSPRPDPPSHHRNPPWPRANDALNALPGLYDHYEQRSMRHVMRQYSQPDLTQPSHRFRLNKHKQDQNALYEPSSPGTARYVKSSGKTSPTINSARTCSSRQTRTSSATERSFGSADLRQTSVLLLSDSDDEDDVAITMPYLKSPTLASVKRRPSKSSVERRPSMPEIRLPPQIDLKPVDNVPPASRSQKRASSLLAHTLTGVPGGLSIDSASTTNDGHSLTPTVSSRRVSLASTHSAATAQSRRSSYSIREARAITLKSTRHPSPLVHEASDEVRQQTVEWKPTFQRESVASPTEQPSPPLSPTSVDFYIRSAHSSVDGGADSPSRLMAVSRQEEMLLSALRNKERFIRSSSLAELRESAEWELDGGDEAADDTRKRVPQRRGSRGQCNRASRPLMGPELSPKSQSQFQLAPRRWSAAADSGPRCSKRFSDDSVFDELSEKVPLFLDTEPRPDLNDFRDWRMACTTQSHSHSEPQRRGSSKSDSGAPPSQCHPESFARLAGVIEETPEAIGEETDVPRPDSPISPPEPLSVVKAEQKAGGSQMASLSPGGSAPAGGGP
ncbi:hypothetical protein CDD80_3620 [Ophiocordyceps camponoti-rufipedis]|uniref:Uncharacterized protein n=1 Tax=Ophiocordyceps camponoti-rufipedis TaxID=2004952 RepID=A0A2C5YY81_9HYPO|nr:hypothetical protein CDD80_3620 [Ophiocordyceps camponoti-rufipedis]